MCFLFTCWYWRYFASHILKTVTGETDNRPVQRLGLTFSVNSCNSIPHLKDFKQTDTSCGYKWANGHELGKVGENLKNKQRTVISSGTLFRVMSNTVRWFALGVILFSAIIQNSVSGPPAAGGLALQAEYTTLVLLCPHIMCGSPQMIHQKLNTAPQWLYWVYQPKTTDWLGLKTFAFRWNENNDFSDYDLNFTAIKKNICKLCRGRHALYQRVINWWSGCILIPLGKHIRKSIIYPAISLFYSYGI